MTVERDIPHERASCGASIDLSEADKEIFLM